ncbi:MAG: elongation factor P [Planctomycetes bacterium]|nr:elongation factor P [Planctomycetota bacterium]MBI3835676.1 elongation factor P [Planctomycetota bacterium]
MIKAVELRKGKTILHDGQPAVVHEAQHVAKGNKRSYMQAKIKNLKSGVISDVRFNVDDRVEVPYVEQKEYEYLYREGDKFVVMDLENYDQLTVDADVVGDAAKWLRPNEKIKCEFFNGLMISFELPFTVELTITDAPPVVKGATATNQSKEAIVETGAKVRVPPFIENGTKIRIDTRTGEYIERAN